jgi:hypothetical protein
VKKKTWIPRFRANDNAGPVVLIPRFSSSVGERSLKDHFVVRSLKLAFLATFHSAAPNCHFICRVLRPKAL